MPTRDGCLNSILNLVHPTCSAETQSKMATIIPEDIPSNTASGCPLLSKGSKLVDPLWARPIQRATQPVVPTNTGRELETMVDAIEQDEQSDICLSAYKGDYTTNFRLAARDVHLAMRQHYAEMMDNIGANVYPLLLLSDEDDNLPGGIGGMITLYNRDLTYQRWVPTPPEYEILKNLSHMVIGVFTIVSPWFKCPKNLDVTQCVSYLDKVKIAQNALVPEVVMKPDLRKRAKAMYDIVEKYLSKWINQTSCTMEEFQTLSEELNVYIPDNIIEAAAIQADAVYPVLKQIKEDMGKDWEKLYVVVPTVWPVSGINPRIQILSRLMTPHQMNTHVVCMENFDNMADYRKTLGRIIGDRASANLILGTKDLRRRDMMYALATRQDLMANACDVAMNNIVPPPAHEHAHADSDDEYRRSVQDSLNAIKLIK